MIEEIQKIIPWLTGLPLIPKIILSFIIVSIAMFLLALIWSKPPYAVDESNRKDRASVHQFKIEIKTPPNNSKVLERPIVEGVVVDSLSDVWVVVHPLETSDYWVQPNVSIKKDGTWKVQIYIGRPGAQDINKHFEIMAIANPASKLKEGDILIGWPEAQWKSPLIEVIRQ